MLAVPAPAHAAAPSVDVQSFRPSTDPGAGLVLEPAATPGAWNANVAGWLSYGYRPLLVPSGGGSPALRIASSLVTFDLAGSVGLGARAAIGLEVPVILYQGGGASPLPASVASGSLTTTGLGDVAVTGKGVLLANDKGGFGLSLLGAVGLPTGSSASFAGDKAPTVTARLLAEYTLLVASVEATAGYALRTEHRTWPDPGGYTFGDSIPWSLGVSVRPEVLKIDPGGRQRWELAFRGALPAGPVGPFGAGAPGSAALSPVSVSAADRIEIGLRREVFLLGAVDVGVSDAVGLPRIRGVVALGWAPRAHDADHDGVDDEVDQCPEIPEDRDGFEDQDGCPDIDNDDDGVLDHEDACPLAPGPETADPRTSGCPVTPAPGSVSAPPRVTVPTGASAAP